MTLAKHAMSEAVKQALMKRALRAHPREVCGFIMNSADPDTDQFVFDVPNVSKRPEHSWQMDPEWQAVAMQDEEAIFGIWHTHPHGPDGPSDTDKKYMLPGMRFFVATENGVYEYEMEN
jgi:proteasome lid subunit RPN8/RPN11